MVVLGSRNAGLDRGCAVVEDNDGKGHLMWMFAVRHK